MWWWYRFIQHLAKWCDWFLYVILHEHQYYPVPWNLYVHSHKIVLLLSIRWVHQNVLLLPQLSLCSHAHQCVIVCCHQHTKVLCTFYCICCCFLCSYNMDWTHVVSVSSHIGHTIIAQTRYNHITPSIALGILPSWYLIFEHFSYVLGSPRSTNSPSILNKLILYYGMSECRYDPGISKIAMSLP